MYTIILTRYGEETDDKIIGAIQTPAKNREELVQAILEIARTNNSVFLTIQSTDLAEKFLEERNLYEFPDWSPTSEVFNEFCAHLKITHLDTFISELEHSDNPIFVIEDGYVTPGFKEFIRDVCNDYLDDKFCSAVPYKIRRLLLL